MTTRKTSTSTSKAGSKPKTATRSTKSARAPAGTGQASAPQPVPGVVTETKTVVQSAELKKSELLESVITRSGVKKKFAKPVIEAMIDILGEAIAEGREINLQPFGKIKHQRVVDSTNARVVVTKIRQSKVAGPALDVEDRADIPSETPEGGKKSSKESVAEPAE